MHRGLVFIASIASALALGCKGCAEKPRLAPEVEVQPSGQPSSADEAKLNSRLGARKITPGKQYPKNADGSTACGDDVDCFVLQAQFCTSATLKNTLHMGAFGIDQRIDAEYRITGKDGDRCKLTRQISGMGISLDPTLEELLRKQGKTADDLARMKQDNERSLRKRNPPLLDCTFDDRQALSVALDIAEGRLDPRPWRAACAEPPGAAPEGAAPAAAPAPNAAPKPSETH